MKVLYIVTAYPRGPGDVITPWLIETIGRVKARGIDVEVLAPSYRGAPGGVMDGVRVHRFRYAPRAWETLTHDQTAPDRIRERPIYAGLVPGYVAAGSLAAARLARTGDFDVLHAFWPLPHGLLGLVARRASGVPLVSTFFGVELTWAESQLRVLNPAIRKIAEGSDAVTVISSHTGAALRRIAPGVTPQVIPFGAAAQPAVATAARERRPGDPLDLLFIGRLVERKGVHVLIDALSRGGEDRLTVIGDGPERTRLEEAVRERGLGERVRFTGSISSEELRRRIEKSDALLLPAVRDTKGDVEGLGVVLIEALLAGRPVIASRSGGIVDIVRHEETGLLVEPGDPVALAAAITRFRDEPGLARTLAAKGRQHVQAEFSWDRIIDRLEQLYRDVARK